MNANQEIIAELRRVLGERDAAREQLDLTKRELGRWVDREAQAVRECDELRAQRGLALGRLENAIQLANQYAEERDDARSTIEDLNDEIARGREAIRIYRTETEAAKRERDEARAALAACPDCAMYAERSGRFAEQADRLQADLDDCRARSADMRTMLERVTRERDLALGRLEAEVKSANQARMAEERARESLDELDAAIYDCLPWGDDESPLDCVERAADRLRELAAERDEARAERDAAIARITEVGVMVATNGNALAKDAYRRGAEAMRETAMNYARKIGFYALAADIRCLPAPEEP